MARVQQAERLIRRYIEPGEKLLWFNGQKEPAAGTNLRQGVVMIGSPLLLVLVGTVLLVVMGDVPLATAIVIAAIGTLLTILLEPYDPLMIGTRYVYGLTNRRAIIIDVGWIRRRTWMLPLESIDEIRVETYSGGKGTITCISTGRSWPYVDGEQSPVAGPLFVKIRNSLEVRDLLLEARRARMATLPGQRESPAYLGASTFDVTR